MAITNLESTINNFINNINTISENLTTPINEVNSCIDNLSNYWSGTSYNNFIANSEEVLNNLNLIDDKVSEVANAIYVMKTNIENADNSVSNSNQNSV